REPFWRRRSFRQIRFQALFRRVPWRARALLVSKSVWALQAGCAAALAVHTGAAVRRVAGQTADQKSCGVVPAPVRAQPAGKARQIGQALLLRQMLFCSETVLPAFLAFLPWDYGRFRQKR